MYNASFEELALTVSMEFSNPFAKLSESKLEIFSKFTKALKTTFSGTKYNVGDKSEFTVLVNRQETTPVVANDKVRYIDLVPITGFCPSYLPKGTKMRDLLLVLEEWLDVAVNVNGSLDQTINHIDILLANPSKLGDVLSAKPIAAPEVDVLLLSAKIRAIQNSKDRNKYVSGKTLDTVRPLGDLYGSKQDLQDSVRVAIKCSKHYTALVGEADILRGKIDRIVDGMERLNALVKKNADTCTPGSLHGVVQQVSESANNVTWLGGLLQLVQMALHSTVSTLDKLSKVTK